MTTKNVTLTDNDGNQMIIRGCRDKAEVDKAVASLEKHATNADWKRPYHITKKKI